MKTETPNDQISVGFGRNPPFKFRSGAVN